MRRCAGWARRVPIAAMSLFVLMMVGCDAPPTEPPPPSTATLLVQAALAGAAIDGVVVEVTAADIATPLAFDLTVVNDTASGTITVTAGSDRTITVRAYDVGGIETHRGAATVDVLEGVNPTVSIRMNPLQGDQPVIVTIGTFLVTVSPDTATLEIGQTVQLAATVIDSTEATVDVAVQWATLNPTVATVGPTGLVTAAAGGAVKIVATYAGVGAAASITVEPAPEGLILFHQSADGSGSASDWDVFAIEPDGTSLLALTDDAYDNRTADIAPDGQGVVFTSNRSGSYALHTMNPDGSGVSEPLYVFGDSPCCGWPRWSPDGSRIAFIAATPTQVFVMNADGSNVVQLTDFAAGSLNPAWSPDGARLALWAYDASGNQNIWVMNADGSGLTQVSTGGSDQWLDWCANDRIVFQSRRAGEWAIYTMTPDGADVLRLTPEGTAYNGPACSPTGAWLAFTVGHTGPLVRSRSDGSGLQEISSITGYLHVVDWGLGGGLLQLTHTPEKSEVVHTSR